MKFRCWFTSLYVGATSVLLTSLVNEADGSPGYVLRSVRESNASANYAFDEDNISTSTSHLPPHNTAASSSKQFPSVTDVGDKSPNQYRTSTGPSYDLLHFSSTEVHPIREEIESISNRSLSDGSASNGPGRRPNPKPMVTNGGGDVDGVKSFNYMVPAAITALALPLLGAAAFFSYTKIRDFWEKRHYRRMDFLIDGMYNE